MSHLLWRAVPLAFFLIAGSAASGFAQAAPTNPCADSLYQALRGKSLNDLSEREYEYFMLREKACTEYSRLAALANEPEDAVRARSDRPLSSETRTQANSMGGVDVYVRNASDRPIVVNSLNVTECRNLRSASCGMHFPKTKIRPGQERRVSSIRFASENQPSNYRYTYHISEAEQ